MTLPDYYSPENMGLIVPKTKDGRVVFMLPWQGATIAGTTGGSNANCHLRLLVCQDSYSTWALQPRSLRNRIFFDQDDEKWSKPMYLPVVNLKITLHSTISYESLQSLHDAPLSLDYTFM